MQRIHTDTLIKLIDNNDDVHPVHVSTPLHSSLSVTDWVFLCSTQHKIGHLETFFPASLLA